MEIGNVNFTNLDANRPMPLLAQPTRSGVKLTDWSGENRRAVHGLLIQHGAILFRGFEIDGQTEFELIVQRLIGKGLDYVYRTTVRTQVGKGVYTATDYPPRLTIPFHNENAYQRDWPMHLAFFCAKPAEEGGETPIADTVKVTERIDGPIRERFERKRVMYVRNYRPGLDIPWQVVFQTEDRHSLEAYCREHDIGFEWKEKEWLQTRQVCHATAVHPTTERTIWFNQAHLFHSSIMDERTRQALRSLYGEDAFPRNAFYGDGTAIEEEALERVREAYKAEAVTFSWRCSDMMLLDNMLVSHSRNPYKGTRKILVSMANPYSAVKDNKAMNAEAGAAAGGLSDLDPRM